jgi:hypothetical protein
MRGRQASGRLGLFAAAALVAALVPSAGAGAVTITPSTTSDVVANDGQCSLREAVTAAKTHVPSGSMPGECPGGTGSDVIVLSAAHYLLSIPGAKEDANASGDLDVGSDLTIKGAGAGATTIETNQPDRVVEILAGVTATIEGVTVTGGSTPAGTAGKDVTGEPTSVGGFGGEGEGGGGILNKGTLTLVGCTITGNTTGEGGKGGSATGNPGGNGVGGSGGAGGAGGGIESEGALTVISSLISHNSTGIGGLGGTATGSPGGLEGDGGFGDAGPAGPGGPGGGIAAVKGALTVRASTITFNTTGAGGRGGFAEGASGEASPGAKGGFGGFANGSEGGTGGFGGGLYAAGAMNVSETTISDNVTGAGGFGGLGHAGNGGTGSGAEPGGEGGVGGGGSGGEGGSGAGISTGLESSGEITRSAIVRNTTGAGGPANVGDGGGGGKGGSGGGSGGPGGGAGGGDGGQAGIGAGVEMESATGVTIRDTTISENAAGTGGTGGAALGGNGGLGGGGGPTGTGGVANTGNGGDGGFAVGVFVNNSRKLTLSQVTVAANAVGTGGSPGPAPIPGTPGGVGTPGTAGATGSVAAVSSGPFAHVSATDSILAAPSPKPCSGTITDGGHDISFPDATCPGTVSDPKLGPVQSNGGPTPTEAIAAGSPALDAVPAMGAGCEPTDQRGVLRPAGTACDIGAFELAVPSASTGAASGVGTTGATLAGVARNPDVAAASASFQYGTTLSYGKQTAVHPIGATSAGAPFSIGVSGLAPGTTYHFRAVVTNAAGSSFGVDGTFRTAAKSAAASTPAITGLSMKPSRVLPEKGRGASIAKAKAKRGAVVAYRDSEAATAVFKVQRAKQGFRVGKKCEAARPKHARGRARHCTRLVQVGTFTHADAAGPDSFHFSGRAGGRPLAPGSYRLTAMPKAGSVLGRAATLAFTVI